MSKLTLIASLALSVGMASAQAADAAAAPAKKFEPSAKAKQNYAKCMEMPDPNMGSGGPFDCGNFLRPDAKPDLAVAKASKAKPAKSNPTPNYFGEGCESGCYLPPNS